MSAQCRSQFRTPKYNELLRHMQRHTVGADPQVSALPPWEDFLNQVMSYEFKHLSSDGAEIPAKNLRKEVAHHGAKNTYPSTCPICETQLNDTKHIPGYTKKRYFMQLAHHLPYCVNMNCSNLAMELLTVLMTCPQHYSIDLLSFIMSYARQCDNCQLCHQQRRDFFMDKSYKIVFRLRFHLFCAWSKMCVEHRVPTTRWPCLPLGQQPFFSQLLWQQQVCQQQVDSPSCFGLSSLQLQPGNSTSAPYCHTGSASSSGWNSDEQFVMSTTSSQILYPPPGLPHPLTDTCNSSVQEEDHAAPEAVPDTGNESVQPANAETDQRQLDADELVQQVLDHAAIEKEELRAAHAQIQTDMEIAAKEIEALKSDKEKIQQENAKLRDRLKEKTANYGRQLQFFERKLVEVKIQKQELEDNLNHANEKIRTN